MTCSWEAVQLKSFAAEKLAFVLPFSSQADLYGKLEQIKAIIKPIGSPVSPEHETADQAAA